MAAPEKKLRREDFGWLFCMLVSRKAGSYETEFIQSMSVCKNPPSGFTTPSNTLIFCSGISRVYEHLEGSIQHVEALGLHRHKGPREVRHSRIKPCLRLCGQGIAELKNPGLQMR